jgi:threonine synthase
VVISLRRLIRNLMLLAEPCARVDETAAIAAERSVGRRLGPFNLTATGGALDVQAQQVRKKGTSVSTCTGRPVASSQFRKRMVQRCWLPLISGNNSASAGSVTRTS